MSIHVELKTDMLNLTSDIEAKPCIRFYIVDSDGGGKRGVFTFEQEGMTIFKMARLIKHAMNQVILSETEGGTDHS